MIDEKALEAAMAALYKCESGPDDLPFEDSYNDDIRDEYRRNAKAVITTYLAALPPIEHRGDCTKENFTCQLCNAYNEGYDDAKAALPPVDGEAGEIVRWFRSMASLQGDNPTVYLPRIKRSELHCIADLIEALVNELRVIPPGGVAGDCILNGCQKNIAPPVDGEAGDLIDILRGFIETTAVSDVATISGEAARRAADLIERLTRPVEGEAGEVVKVLRATVKTSDICNLLRQDGLVRAADLIERLWQIKKDAAAEIGRLQERISGFGAERKEWERLYSELEARVEEADSDSTSPSSPPSGLSDELVVAYREDPQSEWIPLPPPRKR